MEALLVSTFDNVGGAGRAAYRLHQGLQSINVQSDLLVLQKTVGERRIHSFPGILGKGMRRVHRRLDSLPLRLYPSRQRAASWSLNWLPYPVANTINALPADVIHLHWTGFGFITIRALGQLRKPMIWTFHDSWAFTGGCHVPFDCTRYQQACGRCPQLSSHREQDLSRWVWQQKRKHWGDVAMTIVTPSRWLADCAHKSSLFSERDIRVIPNGLDTSIYQPIDGALARSMLKLPQDRKLILFGAVSSTSDRNKGFHLLQPALQKLKNYWMGNAALVIFGAERDESASEFGFQTHYLGEIRDEIRLALAYAAADVFVCPSLQENLPNTIMEAMACGIPSVGFHIGGLPDLINHQETGYLAPPYEIDELARGIAWVLEDDERHQRLSINAREKLETNFDIEKVARQYASLYEEVIEHARKLQTKKS